MSGKKPFAECKKDKSALLHLYRAFTYTCSGIASTFKSELAFRLEIYLFAPLTFLILLSPLALSDKALLICPLLLILALELVNSAIEAVVDDISKDYRPLAKKAKDCGSAAVFFAMLIAGIIWFTVFSRSISEGEFARIWESVKIF